MRESHSSLQFLFQCRDCWSLHRGPKLAARDTARGRCRCAGAGHQKRECHARRQLNAFCLAILERTPKVAPTSVHVRARHHQFRFRRCQKRHCAELCHRSDKSPGPHNQSSTATQCCARAYLCHRLIVHLNLAAVVRGSRLPGCSYPRRTAR